jgi:hypothetical protein
VEQFESALGIPIGESGQQSYGEIEHPSEVFPNPGLSDGSVALGEIAGAHGNLCELLTLAPAGRLQFGQLAPRCGRVCIRNQAPLPSGLSKAHMNRIPFPLVRFHANRTKGLQVGSLPLSEGRSLVLGPIIHHEHFLQLEALKSAIIHGFSDELEGPGETLRLIVGRKDEGEAFHAKILELLTKKIKHFL